MLRTKWLFKSEKKQVEFRLTDKEIRYLECFRPIYKPRINDSKMKYRRRVYLAKMLREVNKRNG